MDKGTWSSQHTIATKDPAKPFPVQQPVPVLKWRYVTKDENQVPLSGNYAKTLPNAYCAVSFWPSANSGSIDCTAEFELMSTKLALKNVVISIPIAYIKFIHV